MSSTLPKKAADAATKERHLADWEPWYADYRAQMDGPKMVERLEKMLADGNPDAVDFMKRVARPDSDGVYSATNVFSGPPRVAVDSREGADKQDFSGLHLPNRKR